jgi:hypothetical protein
VGKSLLFLALLSSLPALPARAATAPPPGAPLRALLLAGPDDDHYAENLAQAFDLRRRDLQGETALPALTAGELAVDVVFIGSRVMDLPRGAAFLQGSSAALMAFVGVGGVLVELEQDVEGPVPFLPPRLQALRTTRGNGEMHRVADSHPLLARLTPELLQGLAPVRQFAPAARFRTLLASDPDGRAPVALEAAEGRGRIVLLSLPADRAFALHRERLSRAAEALLGGLDAYARLVRAGHAPRVKPTRAYRPPRPLPFKKGAWTLVVLPDTQGYSWQFPETFAAQTGWIAANRESHRIAFVAHVGDVVEHDVPEEWAVADRSLAALDGLVPYAIALGNHDFAPGKLDTPPLRASLFDSYFPLSRLRRTAAFGGAFPDTPAHGWNTYWTFEAGGRGWLLVALEMGPRPAVVAWARDVLAHHPERRAIVVTHAYLYSDDSRYDLEKRPYQKFNPRSYRWLADEPPLADGEMLWRDLVSPSRNVALVLSGHVLNDGVGRLASRGAANNVVHQLLADYQIGPNGGDGFLRLLEFQKDGHTVFVKTYSPSRNEYKTDSQNQFVLDLGSEAYRLRR